MNRFTIKNIAPQAEKYEKVKNLYQEFEENKKYMERFFADCIISVMEG
jgi:ribosomal protein S17E